MKNIVTNSIISKRMSCLSVLSIAIYIKLHLEGFEGSGTGSDGCSDVDECSTAKHNCDVNALCSNNDGGYTCTCKAGYNGDGVQCECELRYSNVVVNSTLRATFTKRLKLNI